jgi:hypothetical protein
MDYKMLKCYEIVFYEMKNGFLPQIRNWIKVESSIHDLNFEISVGEYKVSPHNCMLAKRQNFGSVKLSREDPPRNRHFDGEKMTIGAAGVKDGALIDCSASYNCGHEKEGALIVIRAPIGSKKPEGLYEELAWGTMSSDMILCSTVAYQSIVILKKDQEISIPVLKEKFTYSFTGTELITK